MFCQLFLIINIMETTLNKNQVDYDIKIAQVWWDANSLYFELQYGRVVGAPLSWFPKLQNATESQLKNWQLVGLGRGVHWLDLDEHLSVYGMFTFDKN
jgi:hypothetical protein